MAAIGISEFRSNMSAILQRVQQGEIISLLVRETEVAKLVPPDYARLAARQQLEDLRQTAVVGDLLAPLDESWDAEA
ncbi:MAG: type II toxin-antitoxin system Phd/YefM family antitoxin [Caldilineaceae bacterium]